MQNLLLESYSDRVLYILASAGGGELSGVHFGLIDNDVALIQASVHYPGGSRLNVHLLVDGESEFPEWIYYSFHYMTRYFETVFRYDNAPHHRGLYSFPHHKHEGAENRISSCDEPSVRTIRNEIEAYIRGNG